MRGAAAFDLGLVLGGAREAGRVGSRHDAAAIVLDQGLQALGGQRRVERDLGAGLGKSGDVVLEGRRRAQVRKLRQIGFGDHRQLALVHEQPMRPLGREDREAERQRRVRHVAAANVEGPGDRRRVGQHGMRGAVRGDRRGQPRELVPGQFAGIGDGMDFDRCEGRLRLVRPQMASIGLLDSGTSTAPDLSAAAESS